MQDSNLANELDLWGFESGVMVFKDLSLGCGFELPPIDVSSESDEVINILKHRIRQFLNGLPSGLSIQFIQEITCGNERLIEAHGNVDRKMLTSFQNEILEARLKKFHELDKNGEIPRQRIFALIRKKFDSFPKSNWSNLKFWNSPNISLHEGHLKAEIQKFERVLEIVISQFSNLGLKVNRLTEQETFTQIYRQWNPDRQGPENEITAHDVRDQFCLTDCVIGIDNFSLGGIYHKVISLKMLPENTFSAMAQAMQKLPFESRLFFSIEVLDQQKEISGLQMQRRMAYAATVGKKGVSDLDSKAKLRDLEGILEELIQGSEHVFNISLQVILRSPDMDLLQAHVSDTLSLIRDMNGAEGMLETVAAFDIFKKVALPHAKAKERTIKVNTNVLCDLVPVYGNWKGHNEAKVLLRSKDGGLLPFDPFSKTLGNSNMIISGGSGVGKSFFANSLISQMMKERPKVFILDIGGSYKRTCENLDGQYIELGIKAELSINPFDMRPEERADPERMDQKIKFLVTVVEIMTKEDGKLALGKLEKAELEKLIKKILIDESKPRLSHLMEQLLKHEETEIKRLGKILSLWCGDSPFGKIVDRTTTVELNRDVICFDLKNLDSHVDLQAICLFLITDLIWREVQRDKTEMKFTIFDECWRLLQDDSAAQFIGDVFRTFRKYRASAIAISQNMDDFVNSKVAGAIMPNSSLKWLLRQKATDQASLKRALSLNDNEMEQISSLESKKGFYSEVFLMAESKRQVVKIDSTPIEYWLFTTEPNDLLLMNDEKTRRSDLSDLEILRKLAKTYPQGAATENKKDFA